MLAPFRSLLVCCVLLWTAPALGDPIVFDFEDDEQGWSFWRARREEASVLGGSFAVFGSDGARMSLHFDLTGLKTMTLEQFWISKRFAHGKLVWVGVFETDENGNHTTRVSEGMTVDPENPDLLTFDLFGFSGMGGVVVLWNQAGCNSVDACPPPNNFIGYIDNITFHPIPEPGHLALLGLLGVLGVRWFARRSRC